MKKHFLNLHLLFAMLGILYVTHIKSQAIISGPTCIPYTATNVLYSITAPGATNFRWSVAGDLSIASIGSGSLSANINSSLSAGSSPFRLPVGKGRVCVTYSDSNSSICGDPRVCMDVFKQFQDPSKFIVGPQCIRQGDTVTYSIDAMVSVNQQQQIGIDSYYWSYTPSLVNSILYFSGDSSSITFIAGAVGFNDSLFVDVGRCNLSDGFKYALKIGLSIDTPQFVLGHAPMACLPFGQTPPTLIFPAQPGVTYSWTTKGSWGITSNTRGDTATLFPDNSTGILVLTAVNQCETKKFEYTINRSLSDSTYIVASTYTCLPAGQTLQFHINGLSGGVKMQWGVTGTGWQILPGQENSTAPFILTGTSAGTLVVSTFDCPSPTASLVVQIKPDNPAAISGTTCLPAGSTANQTYSIPPVNNATSYDWFYPSGWSPVGPVNNTSIVLQPDGTTSGFVKVVAQGCAASDTSYLHVAYGGLTPDTILVSKTCVNVGTTGNLTFSVSPTHPGETYEWDVQSTLGTITNYNSTLDSSQVNVQTIGTVGTYTVRVRAKNNCGVSGWTTLPVTVAGLTFTVQTIKAGSTRAFFVDPDPVPGATYYTWYWNGSLYDQGPTVTGISITGNPASGTGCVEVLSTAGCITRQCKSFPSFMRLGATSEESEAEQDRSWKAYPNPTDGLLNLEFSSSDTYEVFLFDGTGRMVVHKKITGQLDKLDISSLPNGSYNLAVRSAKLNHTKTIVISK